ncbi:hypothetical protein [Corynebacterium aurimucosum]|uniref:hypothetical protein n=1 Tax=Corynebacterium aurimucosum TaxID=169292 RepID=UPI001364B790|nr:hypothetical protein [Corynebacterium aurimucosum]
MPTPIQPHSRVENTNAGEPGMHNHGKASLSLDNSDSTHYCLRERYGTASR